MIPLTVKTYEFARATAMRFHGGRWDGLEVETMRAPPVLHIATGTDSCDGTVMEVSGDAPETWVRYERQSSFVPPINYVMAR